MQVFISDLSKISKKSIFMEKYAPCLTKKDKECFEKMTHLDRKLQFLMGRLMIYRFLGRRFKIEKSGKLTHKKSFLSLSHSGHLVVLALSHKPVGIDTENTSKKRNFKAIGKFLGWENCVDSKEFYKSFTQYEADYKLGKEYKNPQHIFFSWKKFIICVASLSADQPEVFEYFPD